MDFSEQLFAKFSGCRIFCGFSGGADSTAALLLARKLQPRFEYELHAIHFNHHLRGKESDLEAENAAKAADSLLKDIQTVIDKHASQQYDSKTKMATVEVDGNACIGILSIPDLGLELPVLTDWSYAKLKKAPYGISVAVVTIFVPSQPLALPHDQRQSLRAKRPPRHTKLATTIMMAKRME